ncbi:MAG: InlB B-repeat-containing protein [Firmicutes bacterium]|nr:InlB B-repeat-containing protein [Bacillota bacterium]
MKKKFFGLLLIVVLVATSLTLFACGEDAKSGDGDKTPPTDKAEYTVVFDIAGGTGLDGFESGKKSVKVEEGQKVSNPGTPAKTDFVFEGWFEGASKFDFASAINADKSLVAHYKEQGTPGIGYQDADISLVSAENGNTIQSGDNWDEYYQANIQGSKVTFDQYQDIGMMDVTANNPNIVSEDKVMLGVNVLVDGLAEGTKVEAQYRDKNGNNSTGSVFVEVWNGRIMPWIQVGQKQGDRFVALDSVDYEIKLDIYNAQGQVESGWKFDFVYNKVATANVSFVHDTPSIEEAGLVVNADNGKVSIDASKVDWESMDSKQQNGSPNADYYYVTVQNEDFVAFGSQNIIDVYSTRTSPEGKKTQGAWGAPSVRTWIAVAKWMNNDPNDETQGGHYVAMDAFEETQTMYAFDQVVDYASNLDKAAVINQFVAEYKG